jgi:hypothetical protein
MVNRLVLVLACTYLCEAGQEISRWSASTALLKKPTRNTDMTDLPRPTRPYPVLRNDPSDSESGASPPTSPSPEIIPVPTPPKSDGGGAQETSSQHSEPPPAVTYKVGYGRPPRSGCFKKGQRANPRGRPKGAKSAMTIFREEAEVLINVRENGRTRKMSKLRVGIRNVMNDLASKPDLRSMLAFLKLLAVAQGPNFEIAAQKTSGEEEAYQLSTMAEAFMRDLAAFDPTRSLEDNISSVDE